MGIFRGFKIMTSQYPRQYWLLLWGMLISTIGASMIWPFILIFLSKKLDVPLTVVTLLMALNNLAGLVFSFLAAPVIDRIGRKWVMVVSLAVNALSYVLMTQANSLLSFAVLQAVSGAFNPLYRVGADAMMADLIPAEQRVDAYSVLRTAHNVGVALGPAIGGFITATSYNLAFQIAAAGMAFFGVLVAFYIRETLPQGGHARPSGERFGGYGRVFRDRQFMPFAINFVVTQIVASIMWMLLPVYANRQFGIAESAYGLLPTTNALLVVTLQLVVTRLSRGFAPLRLMALGTLLYTIAVVSVALGKGFWWFWVSMVIMTFGEMILVPPSTTYAANLAPPDMRGRYMGIYGVTWNAAAIVGPVFGGLLNDTVSPAATWWGGGVVGLVSVIAYLLMAAGRRRAAPPAEQYLQT